MKKQFERFKKKIKQRRFALAASVAHAIFKNISVLTRPSDKLALTYAQSSNLLLKPIHQMIDISGRWQVPFNDTGSPNSKFHSNYLVGWEIWKGSTNHSVWSKITGSVVWGMSGPSYNLRNGDISSYDLGTMLANYQKKSYHARAEE